VSTIVVGFIDSPEGQAALEKAVEEATLRSARLIIVHSEHGGQTLDIVTTTHYDARLAEVREDLAAKGLDVEIRTLVRGHDAASDLLDIIDEVHADLAVIGLRRRSPVGKLVLGSNSQQILLDAKCPVLAVKAD
jgi:nucleotide-binding universal stress UspA family protein